MLGNALKREIESFYEKARAANPLFAGAARGEIVPGQVKKYLENIHYLVSHTPIHLKLAIRCAEQRGMTELADFFRDKIKEESGHDAWAESDMKKVSDRFAVAGATKPSPAMVSLVSYIQSVIEKDPSHYLAYILTSEYFTVLIGPQWLSDLEERCGIPREMMSVVGNHAELDKHHVIDDLAEMEKLFDEKQPLEPLKRVVNEALGLFDKFAREVGEGK